MSNSLQEQLLKAGLVTEEDVARADADAQRAKASARRKTDGRGSGRQGKHPGKGGGPKGRRAGANGARKHSTAGASARGSKDASQVSSASASSSGRTSSADEANMPVGLRSAKRRSEDLMKDGKLRSFSPEKRQREVKRQSILRIIERSRLDRPDADLVHNFVRGTRIKSIYFTAEQREAFRAGELVVVSFEGRISVVPSEKADAMLEIDGELFVHRHESDDSSDGVDEDGYPPVPDDMTW